MEGDEGLLEDRQRLQALGDETKRALKKNVYDNYLKFIDAAKEISSNSFLISTFQTAVEQSVSGLMLYVSRNYLLYLLLLHRYLNTRTWT